MEQFVSFAWIGGTSVVTILLWRLYVAVDSQRQLEKSLTANMESLETERQDLGELIQSQTETLEALTQENQDLKRRLTSHLNVFSQLQADHQSLQQKCTELEQDLLKRIAQEKTLSETLQAHQLEKSRLHRQCEKMQDQQAQQVQEQQSLRMQHQEVTDKNQLYQKVIQAAKVKVRSLKQDKKQLERDLQQALYQVVALEQEYQLDEGQPQPQRELSMMPSVNRFEEPILPQFR